MAPVIILLAIIAIPALLLTVLRVNAAIAFLSLCLGVVLVQFISPDANQFLTLYSAHVAKGLDNGNNIVKIVLLLLPLVLTVLIMMKTVKGSKLLINLLPAICTGLLACLLLVPLLTNGSSSSILHSNVWHQMNKNQDIIVGASGAICLIVLWLQRPKHKDKKSKHHHKD